MTDKLHPIHIAMVILPPVIIISWLIRAQL